MRAMFKAILLDFNGVVVDDEPWQEVLYIEVLRGRGINLTPEQYREHFLGKDDYSIARHALELGGHTPTREEAVALAGEKTQRYLDTIGERLKPVPGAADFMREAARRGLLGIVSGAPRAEIEHVLGLMNATGLLNVFVPLEEFERGKPDPQGYLLALARLNMARAQASQAPVLPGEVLVIEDSRAGFRAGLSAGMAVAALTTAHPASDFPGAWAVAEHLAALHGPVMEKLSGG